MPARHLKQAIKLGANQRVTFWRFRGKRLGRNDHNAHPRQSPREGRKIRRSDKASWKKFAFRSNREDTARSRKDWLMKINFSIIVPFALFVSSTWIFGQTPVPTGFTYQGRLNVNNAVANGLYSFQFRLLQTNNGQYQGPILTNQPVAVSNGIFTTALDFGDHFGSRILALEIGVRTNGSAGAFTLLSPNQT